MTSPPPDSARDTERHLQVNSSSWHAAFQEVERPHGPEPLEVEGRLPEGLRGTLYRNGPGSFGVGEQRLDHWFDGDGFVQAVSLDGTGRAWGAARFVQTEGRAVEQAAGRVSFAGFGTRGPWLQAVRQRVKNAANTSLMSWQGRLFGLWEGGLPTELDPDSLDTLGVTDLEGVVSTALTAHPKRVPAREETWAFGVSLGRRSFLELMVFPDSGPARRAGRVPLPFATMVHDLACTERHLIFLVAPLPMDIPGQLLGLRAFADNLRWRPELGARVLVVPMDDPEQVRVFETDACFAWHFANAFELGGEGDGGDRIVCDLVRYPDWGTNRWLVALARNERRGPAQGRAWRLELDLVSGSCTWTQRWSGSCEFPRIDGRFAGRPARHAWLCAHDPQADGQQMFTQLVRLDPSSGEVAFLGLEGGRYPSEPVFVPRGPDAAEGDGWILAMVYDASSHRSFLGVWEAQSTGAGPVARCWFDHHLPFSFHGGFAPGLILEGAGAAGG